MWRDILQLDHTRLVLRRIASVHLVPNPFPLFRSIKCQAGFSLLLLTVPGGQI